MAYVSPKNDWAVGNTPTSAQFNIHANNQIWLAELRPRTRVTKSATQSLTNATETAVTWNTESFDVGGCHSTSSNTERITVPTGAAGLWRFSTYIVFASNATGYRQFVFYLNGVEVGGAGQQALNGGPTRMTGTLDLQLVATDNVEVRVIHSAGAAINILTDSWFFGQWEAATAA